MKSTAEVQQIKTHITKLKLAQYILKHKPNPNTFDKIQSVIIKRLLEEFYSDIAFLN